MAARNLLLVVFGDIDDAELESAIRRKADSDAEVRLIAPPELSRLRWLFMDVDRARGTAHERAERIVQAVTAHMSVHAGVEEPAHPSARQAIEDALRTFPADAVLVVTHPQTEASWQEKQAFDDLDDVGVPVTVLPVAGGDHS